MKWNIVGTSVKGSSHEKTGKPCQDTHGWIHFGDTLFIAVADGAGSAKYAEVGSALAVQSAMQTIQDHSAPKRAVEWTILLQSALYAACEAIRVEATMRGSSPSNFHTTLLITIATPKYIVSVQVGDGATVVGDADGNITALTKPQTGEYANVTTFLTSPNAFETMETTVWEGETAHIASFSDGLQMLALEMPAGTAFAPFFTPLFQTVARSSDELKTQRNLAKFLGSSRIREKTDDDITLILATVKED